MVLPKIKTKLEKLNSVEFINTGGCGISALAIYRFLEKHGAITDDTCFIYLYAIEDKSQYESNRVKECGMFTPPAHIIVKHGEYYIDSTKISKRIKDFKYAYYSHEATLDELMESINTCRWNWLFNRKTNVRNIAKIMDVKLDDVKV